MTDGEKREAAYKIADALKKDIREEYAMILERNGDAFSLCAEDALYEFAEEDVRKKVRNVLEREFFVFIREKTPEKEKKPTEDTPAQRAIEFIHKNYQNNINAAAVADATNCLRGKLDHEMRKATGCSISEYLRKVRVEKAAELMRDEPSISVRECAELCGLGSEKTMVRAFKAEFGMTPREYKISAAEKVDEK